MGEVEESLYHVPAAWKAYIEKQEFAQDETLTELHVNQLRHTIMEIYRAKLVADENHRAGIDEHPPAASMDHFVLDNLTATYGAPEIVHTKLRVMLQSLIINIHQERWISTFADFCGIAYHDKRKKNMFVPTETKAETLRLFFGALTMCKKYFVRVDILQVLQSCFRLHNWSLLCSSFRCRPRNLS